MTISLSLSHSPYYFYFSFSLSHFPRNIFLLTLGFSSSQGPQEVWSGNVVRTCARETTTTTTTTVGGEWGEDRRRRRKRRRRRRRMTTKTGTRWSARANFEPARRALFVLFVFGDDDTRDDEKTLARYSNKRIIIILNPFSNMRFRFVYIYIYMYLCIYKLHTARRLRRITLQCSY